MRSIAAIFRGCIPNPELFVPADSARLADWCGDTACDCWWIAIPNRLFRYFGMFAPRNLGFIRSASG